MTHVSHHTRALIDSTYRVACLKIENNKTLVFSTAIGAWYRALVQPCLTRTDHTMDRNLVGTQYNL